jgi:mRNA deadenylase 3'-5' endonuclease subunit Ccr4
MKANEDAPPYLYQERQYHRYDSTLQDLCTMSRITVCTYNVLANKYATSDIIHTAQTDIDWNRRSKLLQR